jgi:DNA topoisomerase-1
MNKFNSQQARRILDRLVGYQLSPLLWTKVKRGLSAGRVQSVAVKMICDREREIQAFESKEYWSLTAHLQGNDPPPFTAKLIKYDNKKADLKNEEDTNKIISDIQKEPYEVVRVSKKKKKRNPPPPFITSLLQQEASRKLGFSAKKTMAVAQGLYEGVELGSKGRVGLITYMRTDSFRISNDAIQEVRALIGENYGEKFLPEKPNSFRSRKGAQEAHEAIRPTSALLEPDSVSEFLNKDQRSLYSLIWKRFVACQMTPAILDQTQADIASGKAEFRASGSVIAFKGFSVLYQETENNSEKEKSGDGLLPPLKKGNLLKLIKLEPNQHFTQPPPRYTEATLIKALEENGIGRPSTYASILANISGKEYVTVEKKRFKPTELGFLVTDLLVKSFPDIIDTAFTAQMENKLDKIENGGAQWTRVMKEFYSAFEKDLKKAEKELKGEIETDIKCPECGRQMAIKSGKNGLFLACSGYPECRHTSNFKRDEKGKIVPEKLPDLGKEVGTCESCGRPMIVKRGRFGPFLACSGYPDCKNTLPLITESDKDSIYDQAGKKCKVCGGRMLIKMSRTGQRFLACENFPECKHTESISTNIKCPKDGCNGTIVEKSSRKGRKFYGCDQYPECNFAMWDDPYDDECGLCGTKVLALKYPKGQDPVLVCRKKGCGFKKPLPEE